MKFIEQPHSYITDHGESYLSVTALIKRYEHKKDWDEIATKYAKKHKLDVADVKAAWKEEGRASIEKGIEYHSKKEHEYISQGRIQINGKEYEVVPSPIEDGVKLAIPLKLADGIYPEIIIYSDKYKISGQADLVEVLDGQINIKDYKTVKKIERESYKGWKDRRPYQEMLLYPVSHLMACKYFTYALQLNIYMYLLKTHNPKLKVGDMEIHHVKDNELEIIPVPNLQKEARTILEHYYEGQRYEF